MSNFVCLFVCLQDKSIATLGTTVECSASNSAPGTRTRTLKPTRLNQGAHPVNCFKCSLGNPLREAPVAGIVWKMVNLPEVTWSAWACSEGQVVQVQQPQSALSPRGWAHYTWAMIGHSVQQSHLETRTAPRSSLLWTDLGAMSSAARKPSHK